MRKRLNACRGLATAFCAAFAIIASFSLARAASHEQIIESCRQAHMEELRACVRGKVGNPKSAIGPELEKARQACGGAIVRPCVLREEQKQAAGVAAPSAPKDAPPPTGDAPLEIRTSFVAPPRTTPTSPQSSTARSRTRRRSPNERPPQQRSEWTEPRPISI